jgi:hypothetical protein
MDNTELLEAMKEMMDASLTEMLAEMKAVQNTNMAKMDAKQEQMKQEC